MAVAISEKRLSLQEFLELEERYPERRFKPAANGAIIEMSPSRSHGFLQGDILEILRNWLRTGALPGYWAGTEIIHDLDGWLCVPDVAVLPLEGEDYPRQAPLLAVEIESRSNPRRELRAKAARYLQRGTPVVWLVYPESRSLEIHRAGEAAQTLSGGDVLEGGAALPGFRANVSEIFPPPQTD
ncbi:MAG: Uma2 family endonuclease [Anaerolineaceae bacterium]|nr:Uma2 family endonuclease [Anaerolineaceae bacterium]